MIQKELKTLITALLLLFVSTNTLANSDLAEITTVIENYFNGTSKGKPELVNKAFAESLELQYVDKNGQLKRWLGKDYIANIKPGNIKNRRGKIIAIDITDNAAVVKATVTTEKTIFTDYLLLLKLETGWIVTNKTFTAKKR